MSDIATDSTARQRPATMPVHRYRPYLEQFPIGLKGKDQI